MESSAKSPYPWISDSVYAVWSRRANSADVGRHIVHDALITSVTQDDLKRAPKLEGDFGRLAPTGSLQDHERLLHGTTGPGRVAGAHWPVCCDRLATLVFIHGAGTDADTLIERGSIGGCLLASVIDAIGLPREDAMADWGALAERIRRRKHSGEGVTLFHCRACHRLYGSYSEP